MNRMPCSITDGPQWDDDELFPAPPEPNPDDEHDRMVEDSFYQSLRSSLEPLITPYAGDK